MGKSSKKELLKDVRAEYGKTIIKDLSKEITRDYRKRYNQRNLFNMLKLYETISNFEILQTLFAKLIWSYLLKLITIEDSLKRKFYIIMCVNEGWSVGTLSGRINFLVYERLTKNI